MERIGHCRHVLPAKNLALTQGVASTRPDDSKNGLDGTGRHCGLPRGGIYHVAVFIRYGTLWVGALARYKRLSAFVQEQFLGWCTPS